MKLNIFHIPVGHLYAFLWEVSIHIFCPSFNWVIWFFATELFMFLIYLGVLTLIRNMGCKYFILFHGLPFHSVDCFLCWAETFWLDEIPLVSFWLRCLCCWCDFQNDSVEAFLLHFLLVVLWLQVLHLSGVDIFVYGMTWVSNFILLYVDIQFSQHCLLKKLSFSHFGFLVP